MARSQVDRHRLQEPGNQNSGCRASDQKYITPFSQWAGELDELPSQVFFSCFFNSRLLFISR